MPSAITAMSVRSRKLSSRRVDYGSCRSASRNAWFLPFTYDYLAAGQVAPWYNAMTQGLVLSFLRPSLRRDQRPEAP